MNKHQAYEIFKRSIEQELPVIAFVSLYSGEVRWRLGAVARLDDQHVTIYDIGKGFRTTPLSLVHEVRIEDRKGTPLDNAWSWMKSVLEPKVNTGGTL